MGEGELSSSQSQDNHPVLSQCYLGVRTDGFAAFHTGVGAELVKALQAAVVAILLHVLLPLQGVPAVVAIKLLSHGAHLVPGGTYGGKQKEQMTNGKTSMLCHRGFRGTAVQGHMGPAGTKARETALRLLGRKSPRGQKTKLGQGSPWGLGRNPHWDIPLCCFTGH